MPKVRIFSNENVLTAARKRVSLLFDSFENISVSVSSGKDSTVLYHLALQEAVLRGRKIEVFFLDQEAEYASSVSIIEDMMRHKNVIPKWYQIPIYMTNATSYSEYFLYAWGEGEKWMREKSDVSIHSIDEEYPKRFYEFFPWIERKRKDSTAYLVGLRAEEGIMRYRAVTKFKGWNELYWSTLVDGICKFYPIYDWSVYDVWKFIYDYNIKYNKIYDLMFMDGHSIYTKMRVSNLIHEKSFKCLSDLPRYEPDTYNKLCKRIAGISTAARYATERLIFDNKRLPTHYKNWKEFRDFLLENLPEKDHIRRFKERFARQGATERDYKMQVRQLLINDYEGSLTFDTKADDKAEHIRNKWRALL